MHFGFVTSFLLLFYCKFLTHLFSGKPIQYYFKHYEYLLMMAAYSKLSDIREKTLALTIVQTTLVVLILFPQLFKILDIMKRSLINLLFKCWFCGNSTSL